jgi:cell division protein FtsB
MMRRQKATRHATSRKRTGQETTRRSKPARKPADSGMHPTFVSQLRDFLARNTNAFLIAGLALLLLQDIFGTHGVLSMLRSERRAADIRKQIDALDAENRKLQTRVKSLKSDPAEIERIAREEMGLARPGEYIFKIPPRPGDASDPASNPQNPPQKP